MVNPILKFQNHPKSGWVLLPISGKIVLVYDRVCHIISHHNPHFSAGSLVVASNWPEQSGKPSSSQGSSVDQGASEFCGQASFAAHHFGFWLNRWGACATCWTCCPCSLRHPWAIQCCQKHLHINYHQLPSTTINIHQLPNGSGKTFLSHIPLVQQKTTTLQRGAITAIRSAGSAGLAGLCSTLHHFRGLSRSLSGGSPGSSLGGEIPDISVVI